MTTAHKTLSTLLGIGLAAMLSNNALADANQNRKHDQARHAHSAKKNIDAREHRQKDRIQQGVRSGQLTKEETRSLVANQREIREKEREYRTDGQFTREERKDIQQDLNQASKSIYQEKHDTETRK